MIRYFILFLLVVTSFCAYSQPKSRYSTESEKAIKLFEKAQKSYDNREDDDAIEGLKKALKADPQFIEAHVLLSQLYSERKQYELALLEANLAININPNFFPNLFVNVGMILMQQEKYSEAKEYFKRFLSFSRINPDQKKIAELQLRSAEFAEKAIKNPVPFDPKNLGTEINTNNEEFAPSLTVDEQYILYTVKLPHPENPKFFTEDFYYSFIKDGKWMKGVNLGAPINSDGNEGAQSISPDGQMMFFTACEEAYGYPAGRKGFGSCDIFFTQKTGDKWSAPQNVGPPISSKYWDAQPSISLDGNTIYFASSRPGGKGSSDIWKSTLTKEGFWGTPVNLGDSINTMYSEVSPFIHTDNRSFYFSSEGHPGMGAHDLFISRIDESGNFARPKNLGYPINSSKDEISLVVGASGFNAYYASERKDGFGSLDIYSFSMPEAARPLMVTYLKGHAYDIDSKRPLEVKFELIDLTSGKTMIESYSNPETGEFLVSIPSERNYALNASRPGYLFYSENFSLIGQGNKLEPFKKDVAMNAIKEGEKVVLKNIFFETGSYTLKGESKVELQKLSSFLYKNKTLSIEISGHTDNVGDKKSNQILSENRAKAVYEYLIENGILKERLTFKGFGDTQPLVPNDTEENRAINRRTEFTVIKS